MTRLSLGPLLRLRSDEQLVAAFRAGNDDAFSVLVDRYQQRLFAYVRQMLGGARQDAEDVLQDVFVRAYGALRADDRAVNVRAWLYRVAHNRCIDQLRRPTPAPSEIFEMSRKPLHDPIEEAQRREDLRRLVHDVGQLPEQQRSALLMREIDGMSYADLAAALDTSVPAVKSLLVRARVGLAESAEARDMDCAVIRVDLTEAYDRGVKASGRARRHMKECSGCREYRTTLRGIRRSFAALTPIGFAPLALGAKMLGGLGSAGGGAAATAGAGGGAAATATAGAGIGAAGACKVAAVVCTAALATGGAAVEVKKIADERSARSSVAASTAGADRAGAARAGKGAGATFAAQVATLPDRGEALTRGSTAPTGPVVHRRARRAKREAAGTTAPPSRAESTAPAAGLPGEGTSAGGAGGSAPVATTPNTTGGASAPSTDNDVVSTPNTSSGSGSGSGTLQSTPVTPGTGTPSQQGASTDEATGGAGGSTGSASGEAEAGGGTPPPEH